MMTYKEAYNAMLQMYKDSPIQDQGLALWRVYDDLIAIVHSNAHPLVRVEAAEIVWVLAAGPEENWNWRESWTQ